MLKLSQRLFVAAVGGLLLGSACGGDDTVPVEPPTYELTITRFNGKSAKSAVDLRCDGTLSVSVSIAPVDTFTLRPLNACGTSTRCGYVHLEALTESGEVLASSDSVTLEGLLRVRATERLAEVHEVQVSLRSGVDQKTILNADGSDARASATPTFVVPETCEVDGTGGASGDAGGAGGAPSEPVGGAGAGGVGAGGAPSEPVGGAAGATTSEGGAGGHGPSAGAGGA